MIGTPGDGGAAIPDAARPETAHELLDALGDPLEPDVQLEFGPLRNADQFNAQTSGRRRRPGLRPYGRRTERPGIEHERLVRIQPLGMLGVRVWHGR